MQEEITEKYRPVVLVVLDGFGESNEKKGNPILSANLPTIDKLNRYYPKLLIQASSMSVGLPWGEPGNSEVGHQALGSGVIIYQNLPRINLAIESGKFYQHPEIKSAIQKVKQAGKKLHFMGLVSDGGVHAHIDHLKALMEIAREQGIDDFFIHAILDGRDTPPKSGLKFIKQIQEKIQHLGTGHLASLVGRYYAMDRNQNWDRIEKAFNCFTQGKGATAKDPLMAIKESYQNNKLDEFMEPVSIVDDNNQPIGLIEDGDTVIFFNFRKDRARQITEAFVSPDFKKFPLKTVRPKLTAFITMTQYDKHLPVSQVLFPPMKIKNCLGNVLSQNNKTQLRIAETEKYAHVTYFFNLGRENPFPGEDHVLIPSKNAPSYDQEPEMSAREITDRLEEEINKKHYDFILVNYANADMVGHTGNFNATVEALEILDQCLGQLIKTVLRNHGCLLITADHGNAEELINLKTGAKDTEHSTNPVPLWFVTPTNHREKPTDNLVNQATTGILSDVAPTILELMQIKKPEEMTGNSLLANLK